MCNFLSAIVSRNGEIYCNPLVDSHEDLIDLYHIKDTLMRNIVRVEFRPETACDLIDVSKYVLIVDEKETPEWFEEHRERVLLHLTSIINNLIIKKDRTILVGGVYILLNCKIQKVQHCRILAMENSVVNVMRENSVVKEMWGNSVVNEMGGNSVVNVMGENSVVKEMRENSVVNVMRENSVVNVMRENSVVKEMRENSVVKERN